MKLNKYVGVVLGLLLLMPSGVFASAIGTAAAGNPGARPYVVSSIDGSLGGTFVVPTGVNTLFISGCAAGGGGAGGHTADPGGGGGGGSSGQCIVRMPVLVTQGSTLTITVGTAGIGGAAGSAGGIVNNLTSIAGLPIGTITLLYGTTGAGTGTATNGGSGGGLTVLGGGGATTTTTANPATVVLPKTSGGDYVNASGGGSGGGPSNAGGANVQVGSYSLAVAGGAASGTKGGGGMGGNSVRGVGAAGGSGAIGATCTVGYGAGGGGGAATFAGGNGCPGFVTIEWWN